MKINIQTLLWFAITILASAMSTLTLKKYVVSSFNQNLLKCSPFSNLGITNHQMYIVITFLFYVILFIGYSEILAIYPMHWIYPIWFLSMIFILFSGVIFFNEKIKFVNIIGIILGMLAIYLLIK
jgi:multidrug transporter EmrE-like cation transporter